MTDERFIQTEFAAWTGIVGNIALAVMKGIVGYTAGSKALFADAMYSASAAVSSFAVLTGLRSTKQPVEDEHPYGRVKVESITAIIVSVVILLIGLEVGISSVSAIYHGVDSPPDKSALIVIVVSILFKEIMFQLNRFGIVSFSRPGDANLLERKFDIYSSIAVAAGVGGSILGNYLGNNWLYYLDPLAGLFIAALLLVMGYRFLISAIYKKINHALHNEDSAELLRTVQLVKGVIAVDELRARERGHYVTIDLKISVNPRITVGEGHDVAKMVKQALMKRFIHISDVSIHVNPYDPGYPYKNNVSPEQADHPSVLH